MKVLTRQNKEQGMALFGALIVIIMVAMIGMFALKIAPTYMENYSIKEILQTMKQDRKVQGMSSVKLKSNFLQRARMNSIYTLKPENVEITASGESRKMRVLYIVQKPLIHNIDLQMTFDETVEFPNP